MAFLANQLHQVATVGKPVPVLPVPGASVDNICRGVKTAASIAVRGGIRVRVSGGSGGL